MADSISNQLGLQKELLAALEEGQRLQSRELCAEKRLSELQEQAAVAMAELRHRQASAEAALQAQVERLSLELATERELSKSLLVLKSEPVATSVVEEGEPPIVKTAAVIRLVADFEVSP